MLPETKFSMDYHEQYKIADVGGGCWRQFLLVTNLGFKWLAINNTYTLRVISKSFFKLSPSLLNHKLWSITSPT